MIRIIAVLIPLALAACNGNGDLNIYILPPQEPEGSTPLAQMSLHGLPPSVWSCITNREPSCL